jgi:hypothetical protein
MPNAGFFLLFALMLAGLVAAVTLLTRPTTSVRGRKQLFTLTVLGTLMPYAIHGLQVYESLTTVSSAAGLAIGVYPVLDRWMALLLLVTGLLALVAWMISRTRASIAVIVPLIMGTAYLFGFLPYALTNRGPGTSPIAPPKSWLLWAMLVGVVLTGAAARRLSQLGDISTRPVSDSA